MQAVKSQRWRPAEREDDVNAAKAKRFLFLGHFHVLSSTLTPSGTKDTVLHSLHKLQFTESPRTTVLALSAAGKDEQRNKSLLSSMNISQQHV